MAMNEAELLQLKEKIDSAKTQVAEYEGEKKSIIASLLEHFDCRTLKEAEAKATKLQDEIDNMQLDLEGGIAEIEEKYREIR